MMVSGAKIPLPVERKLAQMAEDIMLFTVFTEEVSYTGTDLSGNDYICDYKKDGIMEEQRHIIIADNLDGMLTEAYEEYLVHAYCLSGSCRFRFNAQTFGLYGGDLLIVRKGGLLESLEPSEDFRVQVVYTTAAFIELSTPQSNYGMRGQLALFLNPVMHLTPEQQAVCRYGFDRLTACLRNTSHHFYRDMLINAMQMLILDFFDFHSHLYGEDSVSQQNASIMGRFLDMLEDKTYRTHREVSYYADRLCVTPKYLSEVSRKVSGYAANYWINRYTILDISRLLRDKSLTFVQISDLFGFSSPGYFSRYVQNHLGVNPTKYRE